MRLIVRILLGLTILGAFAALGLSIWPGVLNRLLFLSVISAVLWLPVVVIALPFLAFHLYRRHQQRRLSLLPIREAIAIPVLMLIVFGLLVFYVPRRIAFASSRSDFELAAAGAPKSKQGVSLDRKLGIYQVDQYAADPRGGVYFRVHSTPDGPDTTSFGFVQQPNPRGTPFGAAHYRVFRLTGDWYWFRVSNDWH